MYGIDTCCNTVMAELHTHLTCRTGFFTQVFLSCPQNRQCGFTTWIMVQMWSTMYRCFYKLVYARLMVLGYIISWVFISKLLFGVIQGQNWYLWWRWTKLLASKLAKRLIISYWRCEGLIPLKIAVMRLLTIYDGAMAYYLLYNYLYHTSAPLWGSCLWQIVK
jgi:hypothetical protein